MLKHEAIKYFGSQSNLAKKLNINQAAISQWGETVPPLRAYEIERLTNGELKVEQDYQHAS